MCALNTLSRRSFFPATLYLSTSKLAVAVVGNLSFASALCMYNLVIKVRARRGAWGPLVAAVYASGGPCQGPRTAAAAADARTGASTRASAPALGPSLSRPLLAPSRTCAPRRQVFLGSLREIELERVKEKLSSAIMETCLALTIFRCALAIGRIEGSLCLLRCRC